MVRIAVYLNLFLLAFSLTQCSQKDNQYEIVNHQIVVDGSADEWQSVPSQIVDSRGNLWIGEGVPEGQWKGCSDLSFSWKVAHNDGKLFFLFEVQDDSVSNSDQVYSWLNDCIEINIDHQNIGGDRITTIGSVNTLEDRLGKRLRGHEMHFLPNPTPKVFLDDTKSVYYTDSAQNQLFKKDWHGEVFFKKTVNGYLMEIGFAIPNFYAQSGQEIGVDVAICDDDGDGRKTLMIWSGYQGEFWLTMDNFKKMILK